MDTRKLPELAPAQVVRLQDALLANADALLKSALAVLEIENVALARSLAILGMEESGKAIAIHERRVMMAYLPEGTAFRCAELDELWGSHQKKLQRVHSFLVDESYWFGVEPADPEMNAASLEAVKSWSRKNDRSKQRGFYVELSKTGAVMAPTDMNDEESLAEIIGHVHQIGWQLRLGEHVEGQRQDDQERDHEPLDPASLVRLSALDPGILESFTTGHPGEMINNAAYRFNAPSEDQDPNPLRHMSKPGYEAETRELLRLRSTISDAEQSRDE